MTAGDAEDRYRDYIQKIVDAAPPLTPEQRARLRVLLAPGVQRQQD